MAAYAELIMDQVFSSNGTSTAITASFSSAPEPKCISAATFI